MGNKTGSKKNDKWNKFRFEKIKNTKGGKQKFHWRAVACNGRIVCSSETYTSIKGPNKTIESFVKAIKKGQFKVVDEVIEV